jgi:peptidyl-tRNA hydrolase, PTH1 family
LWLIAGLGNPGTRYQNTRHNIGFLVIDELLRKQKIVFKEKDNYRIAEGSQYDEKIILLEPLTFMNNSGLAVRKVMQKSHLTPENLIVVHDDLDLATGNLKIRKKGSSGGHKGVESIIQNIGSPEFIRVKIGIGRDPVIPTEKYVLSKFSKDEMQLVREAIERAVQSIDSIIRVGPETTMNRFNRT